MEIIYYCYAGAHTSITAAAIHLGILSPNKQPTTQAILKLNGFDATEKTQLGQVYKYGTDQAGNNIYIASLGPSRQAALSALTLALHECGVLDDSILIVNALSCISIKVRVGGFLSRRLGLVSIGRPLCASGIVDKFDCFVNLVMSVKSSSKVNS